MSKIKEQFSDLRKTTPKHIQWLLMAAAFVIVLILLTLLIGGWRKTTDDIKQTDETKLQLFIDPSGTLDWSNTPVDAEAKKETYTLSASAPVKIIQVRTNNNDIPGLNMLQRCSTETLIIDKQIGCQIIVTYAPTAAMAPTGAKIFIDWRGARETDSLKKTAEINMVLGAVGEKKKATTAEPKPEPKPQPQPEPKPVVVPEPEPEPEPIVEPEPEPTPVKEEIKKDIESIAPSIAPVIPPKVEIQPPEKEEPSAGATEACSDFAFPGYNASGRQIGWIKPERGAYYFHPFSDKNCDSPTGTYNPDNGIITDIKDPSKKIGTDAEHIGYSTITDGALPQLTSAPGSKSRSVAAATASEVPTGGMGKVKLAPEETEIIYSTSDDSVVASTQPYDRSFILRQYKPIPATIVSDVRADVGLMNGQQFLPVRATVDRNVYSDNGRTVIIPTGTLLMGYVDGEIPGPYKAIGRMEIKWYQFVLPNGVEFNFDGGNDPFSGDSQGRIGVPGRGSTDYLEQFVMPMLTAIVPAAVNMIAPVADKFVNQIDLDNNTVVQSGTVRSSELAKNEIITAWNQVAQKLMVDMMDNTTPPFTIPAGTRITVYSPSDLAVVCLDDDKKCSLSKLQAGKGGRAKPSPTNLHISEDDSWVGQVRSFNWANDYCQYYKDGKLNMSNAQIAEMNAKGIDYSTVLFYCQSNQYKAINNAKQDALFKNQQSATNQNSVASTGGVGTKEYNENVLGLTYDDDTGAIVNPFQQLPKEEAPATITCEDGTNPDANGCCTGEIYTDMGDQGFNCCPETGGDCFPPIL